MFGYERCHKHRCRYCGFVWQHGDSMAGNEVAHTCEKCGRISWTRYHGPLKPGEGFEERSLLSAVVYFLRRRR